MSIYDFSQVKSSQVKSSQVKSSQVKSAHCLLRSSTNQNLFPEKNFRPYASLVTGLNLVIFLLMFRRGVPWHDFKTQRIVCEYTLKGVDIYLLRGSDVLYAGFHASPWGCLLQNIFYAGFLPMKFAGIYFTTLHFAVLLLTTCVLYKKTLNISQSYACFISLLSVLSVDYMVSFYIGNAGGMICAFLVMAWLICDEHPYLAGVLIGFAMVKPQDAVIICAGFVFIKRYLPVVIAAVMTISSWGIYSLMTHTGMLTLLSEFLFARNGAAHSELFVGIFSLATENYLVNLGMSMIFGAAFVYILLHCLPEKTPMCFKMYPAFMAVTFWCYSFFNDNYVLIIPSALCIFLMLHQTRLRKILFWFGCALYCVYGLALKISAFLAAKILSGGEVKLAGRLMTDGALGLNYIRTIYEAGIIIIGVIICLELRRIYSEAKS